MEDLRGETEMVNSKSEDEEEENEWDGEDGSVWDLAVLLSNLLPMSSGFALLHYLSLCLSLTISLTALARRCRKMVFECKL